MSETDFETRDSADMTPPPAGADSNIKPLLQLKELGKRSRARGLRLKNEDILVAIDGEMFFGNADELHTRLTLTPPPMPLAKAMRAKTTIITTRMKKKRKKSAPLSRFTAMANYLTCWCRGRWAAHGHLPRRI
ncbi:MAG: hypothetical protein EBT71_01220 [Alphaproteobacteria bacterium]|nr:hypothetical protein [Alphaproteobacteria bacterium]